jgi:protein O-mannosyl-transferase
VNSVNKTIAPRYQSRLLPARGGAAFAAILAATLAAYWRVLTGEFVLDDVEILRHENGMTQLATFLENLVGGWLTRERPLTELTFALQYALWGADPLPFHVVNIALHLANVALVFELTRRVCRTTGVGTAGTPLIASAFFALHPIQSQAVAYIWQRAELLASFFLLASVLLLLSASDEDRHPRALRVAALACFVLGVSAKTVAITAPLAFVLLAFASRRESPWVRFHSFVPFLVTLGAFVAVRLHSFGSRADVGFNVTGGITPLKYFATQLTVIPLYLRLLVFPRGQTVHHDVPLRTSLLDPHVLVASAALLAVAALAMFLAIRSRDSNHPRSRLAAIGVGWFFLLLAPSSSIVPLKDLVMEHRVYLAAWGPFLCAALAVDATLERTRRHLPTSAQIVGVLVVAVTAGLAVTMNARNSVWESRLALWSDAVKKAPNVARPWSGLGDALLRSGDSAGALRCYRRALECDDLTVPRHETLGNIASLMLQEGRVHEAIRLLEQAQETKPDDPALLGSLAYAHLALSDLTSAERYARRAVQVAPMWADPHRTLGGILGTKGDFAGAVVEFRETARLAPDELDNVYNLALATARAGDRAEACRLLGRSATSSNPPLQERAAVLHKELGCSAP